MGALLLRANRRASPPRGNRGALLLRMNRAASPRSLGANIGALLLGENRRTLLLRANRVASPPWANMGALLLGASRRASPPSGKQGSFTPRGDQRNFTLISGPTSPLGANISKGKKSLKGSSFLNGLVQLWRVFLWRDFGRTVCHRRLTGRECRQSRVRSVTRLGNFFYQFCRCLLWPFIS
jgi:hypothetical protein